MKTRSEVNEFLSSLNQRRLTKKELDEMMTMFFGTKMIGEDSTDKYSEADYSLVYTTGNASSRRDFIDMEVFYLKTREKHCGRKVLSITHCELLDYCE